MKYNAHAQKPVEPFIKNKKIMGGYCPNMCPNRCGCMGGNGFRTANSASQM